jgi:hypothetical protein
MYDESIVVEIIEKVSRVRHRSLVSFDKNLTNVHVKPAFVCKPFTPVKSSQARESKCELAPSRKWTTLCTSAKNSGNKNLCSPFAINLENINPPVAMAKVFHCLRQGLDWLPVARLFVRRCFFGSTKAPMMKG